MKNKSKLLLHLLLSILLLSIFSSAEIYSTDPCGQTTIIEDEDTYIYGNDCIGMTVSKIGFNQNFEVNNYLDSSSFQLTMQGISEENEFNDSEILFDDLTWFVDISNNFIEYVSSDNMFRVGYIINDNTFKSQATITNYNFILPNSTLWIKNLVKKSKEQDIISFVKPIVDGVEQPINSKITTKALNTFYWQDVGRGNLIEIDPIYTVDYSPNPSTHLIGGDVDLSPDSTFEYLIGITSEISDNSSLTQYEVFERKPDYPSYLWYRDEGVEETSKVSVVGGTASTAHMEYSTADYGRILLTGGNNLQDGDVIKFYMRPKSSGDTNKAVYLKNSINTIQYGSFNTGTDTSNYNYVEVELSNTGGALTEIYLHDNTLTSGFDVIFDYVEVIDYNYTGNVISSRWSQTYDPLYNWFLMIQKESVADDILTVYAYQNADVIATSEYETKNLSGVGYFYVPVDDLLDYEKNTQSLTFSQLRFYTTNPINFSEVYLRSETNDTQIPTISSCTTNTTELLCGETAHLNCIVTDDSDVDSVLFQINGLNYSTSRDYSEWHYDFSPTANTSTVYDWEYVFAYDLLDNMNQTDPNIQINYTCYLCTENWAEDSYSCLQNDTYLRTYTDSNICGTNNTLPVDNGTIQYCNYCSEDFEQTLGDCSILGNQTVDYIDNNYYSCCAVTGLANDCSVDVLYPYNDTTIQECLYLNNELGDISCQREPNFNINEKEYCLAYIPDEYLNESFKCISDVFVLGTDEIVQTNPEYRGMKSSLLDFGTTPEMREFFTPANKLVNFYFTGKNLNPETDYVLEIQCSSQQRTLKSRMFLARDYENLDFVGYRMKWLKDNLHLVFFFLLFLIIIMTLFYWIILRKK